MLPEVTVVNKTATVCTILEKEVSSSVQHPTNTQRDSITAAVGIFSQVLWCKGLVYKMQLLSPVTESYQLSYNIKELGFLAHVKRLNGSASVLLMNGRCTLIRRNWILVHNKSPAAVWNSKTTVL